MTPSEIQAIRERYEQTVKTHAYSLGSRMDEELEDIAKLLSHIDTQYVVSEVIKDCCKEAVEKAWERLMAKRAEEIKMTDLSFEKAWLAAKNGKSITREEWIGHKYKIEIDEHTRVEPFGKKHKIEIDERIPFLLAWSPLYDEPYRCKNTVFTTVDLLANDWKIVD